MFDLCYIYSRVLIYQKVKLENFKTKSLITTGLITGVK